ncbi:MAG: YitT family protein [Alicyclobacillus sp.]|nr:YitT family protein [Alicyclobacillus sp.]
MSVILPDTPARTRAIREMGSGCLIAFGTCLLALAFDTCLSPNHVLVSGIGGIAILLAYWIHLPLGIVYLLLNAPLFLLGWRVVGFRFLLKSAWGTLSLSAFLFLLRNLPGLHQTVAGSLIGGALSGAALGLVLLAGGTTGGTDILSVVVHLRSGWPIGRIMFMVNTVIVAVGALLFGWERALLTIVSLWVTSQCVNLVLRLGKWDRRRPEPRTGPADPA